jgi:hypothetical protein
MKRKGKPHPKAKQRAERKNPRLRALPKPRLRALPKPRHPKQRQRASELNLLTSTSRNQRGKFQSGGNKSLSTLWKHSRRQSFSSDALNQETRCPLPVQHNTTAHTRSGSMILSSSLHSELSSRTTNSTTLKAICSVITISPDSL